MLRMFKLAKSSASKSRTQAINQLKAVPDGGLVLGGSFGPTALPASGYGKMQACQQP
jgi:hypothetical protein